MHINVTKIPLTIHLVAFICRILMFIFIYTPTLYEIFNDDDFFSDFERTQF